MKFFVCALVVLATCALASEVLETGAPLQEVDSNSIKGYIGQRPVVVGFFLHSCPHCIAFSPVYQQFASEMQARNPNVVVASLSGYDPMSDQLGIKGFPAVAMFPAGSRTPIMYNGDRSLESLFRFLDANAGSQRVGASLPSNSLAARGTPQGLSPKPAVGRFAENTTTGNATSTPVSSSPSVANATAARYGRFADNATVSNVSTPASSSPAVVNATAARFGRFADNSSSNATTVVTPVTSATSSNATARIGAVRFADNASTSSNSTTVPASSAPATSGAANATARIGTPQGLSSLKPRFADNASTSSNSTTVPATSTPATNSNATATARFGRFADNATTASNATTTAATSAPVTAAKVQTSSPAVARFMEVMGDSNATATPTQAGNATAKMMRFGDNTTAPAPAATNATAKVMRFGDNTTTPASSAPTNSTGATSVPATGTQATQTTQASAQAAKPTAVASAKRYASIVYDYEPSRAFHASLPSNYKAPIKAMNVVYDN